MGARGRLPMPDNVRELKGNPGKRRPKPTVASSTKPGIPAPPARIKGEAAAEWKRVTAELHADGRLSKIDRGLLTVYCRTWARWCELDTAVGSNFLVAGARKGMAARKHTLWPLLRETQRDLAMLAKELGLSPNGRARMTDEGHADTSKAGSPWD